MRWCVTAHANLGTLFFREHRARYLATYRLVRLGERLLQVTPVNFMPMGLLKWLEGTVLEVGAVRLNAAVARTRGRLVEATEFDFCIFSAGITMTMLPKIRARRYVYRLKDLLRIRGAASKPAGIRAPGAGKPSDRRSVCRQ